MKNIRNFCIIAHIDHGKSTLADRFLELTGSVEPRKMKAQVLDTMELEREHGITIKLQPARLYWQGFSFNLVDTPGHVDFSYEVSRSLAAVEGALLIVDATQGVQAQTIANLHQAVQYHLKIIPVINKIDLPVAEIDHTREELIDLGVEFACEPVLVSAKTGQNVEQILDAIVKYIPAPQGNQNAPTRALIFDSYFDAYRGVIAYVRVVDGAIKRGEQIEMVQTHHKSQALDVGSVCLGLHPQEQIQAGEIGYIVTALKDISGARVGDTVTAGLQSQPKPPHNLPLGKGEKAEVIRVYPCTIDSYKSTPAKPLAGYREPQPVVYAGLYSTSGEDYPKLRDAIAKLKLNDASLQYEPANSTAFGFGFRVGFLGLLHLEIVKERLEREYGLSLVVTTPMVQYRKTENPTSSGLRGDGRKQKMNRNEETEPPHFPPCKGRDQEGVIGDHPRDDLHKSASPSYQEPWARAELVAPQEYLGAIMQIVSSHRGFVEKTEYFGDRVIVTAQIPLADIIVDFYDRLKAVTSGYGSLSYDIKEYKPADLAPLDVLIADDKIDAFSRLVPKDQAQRMARRIAEKLKEYIPRHNFEIKIQVLSGSKVLAAERITPFRKDVTAKLYGGDVTRKRKLLEKQKRGKRRMANLGKIQVPTEVFVKLLRK